MINHKHWHYDRHWEWQPIKARKIDVLKFVEKREIVTPYNLMNWFGYTYSSARCRLSKLKKEGYIEPYSRGRWCLTDRGYAKIYYLHSLKEKVEEGKQEQEKEEQEVARLKQRVGELESRLSLLHKSLVRISGEIQSMIAPIALLTKQDPKSGLEYYRIMLTRLLVKLNELIKQSAARG